MSASTLLARARRVLRRTRGRPAPASPAPAPEPVKGLVEVFSDSEIKGWVSVAGASPPVPIRLRVNGFDVATTYATAAPDTVEAGDDTTRAALGRVAATGALHAVAPRFHRNSWHQVRPFAFQVDDLWTYTKRGSKVSVRASESTLPIYGHGMYLRPSHNGDGSVTELREKLAAGHIFSQYGKLQLSKKLDKDWQSRVMRLYEQARAILSDEFGHELFLAYGTLLGAIRESGYIAHDIDFDSAYISDRTDGAAAATELHKLALTFVRHGMDAQAMVTAVHLRDPDDADVRIDIFHLYFDEAGNLRFPFGVAGAGEYTRADWHGTEELAFGEGRPLVPRDAERFVEHVYGPGWREPKPGFNWALERTARASDADISPSLRTQSYWTNFYARNDPIGGSTFCEAVNARDDVPHAVIDIGCGNGRDSCAFAAAGRSVIGLDFSDVAVEHATRRAAELGLAERASFRVADVADPAYLLDAVADLRAQVGDAPIVFYLRFFLHAVRAEVQEALLSTIDTVARSGDVIAAEFRTTADRKIAKTHRTHYRRFQDGPPFGARLRDEFGFTVLDEQEGQGLSPYLDEDPFLYRVIARRDRDPATAT